MFINKEPDRVEKRRLLIEKCNWQLADWLFGWFVSYSPVRFGSVSVRVHARAHSPVRRYRFETVQRNVDFFSGVNNMRVLFPSRTRIFK